MCTNVSYIMYIVICFLVKIIVISSLFVFHVGNFVDYIQLIGWRSVSRKLLIYITDAGFHIAGDGKVGGACSETTIVYIIKLSSYHFLQYTAWRNSFTSRWQV